MYPGAEYLTSNEQVAYPLASNQDIPSAIRKFLVDAYFITSAPAVYTLTAITKSSSSLTISIQSSASTSPISLTCSTPSATGFTVLRTADKSVCLVVVPAAITSSATGLSLSFLDKTVDVQPANVNSIKWAWTLDSSIPEPASLVATTSGDVLMQSGYNTTFAITDNEVTLNADPGSGLGLYKCDCPDPGSSGTSGYTGSDIIDTGDPVHTSSGIIRIENDTCLDIIPYHLPFGPRGLPGVEIVHKCVACCQCDQYVARVKTLQSLASKVACAGQAIWQKINVLNAAISDFNSRGHKHLLGSTDTGWDVNLTALKKDPSVGSVTGKTRVRGVVGISNLSGQAGTPVISEFQANSENFSSAEANWFTSDGRSGSGFSLPLLQSGQSVKLTAIAAITASSGADITVTLKVTVDGQQVADSSVTI